MSALARPPRRTRARVADCDRAAARPRGAGDSDASPRLFDELPREPTLEAMIDGAWRSLASDRRTACPICGGEMEASAGAHAAVAAGRCRDCGTTLS